MHLSRKTFNKWLWWPACWVTVDTGEKKVNWFDFLYLKNFKLLPHFFVQNGDLLRKLPFETGSALRVFVHWDALNGDDCICTILRTKFRFIMCRWIFRRICMSLLRNSRNWFRNFKKFPTFAYGRNCLMINWLWK